MKCVRYFKHLVSEFWMGIFLLQQQKHSETENPRLSGLEVAVNAVVEAHMGQYYGPIIIELEIS